MQHEANAIPIEKRPIDYIPIAERHGRAWHLWPVWFSGNAQLATVATGAAGILMGGNLIWTAIAVLLGCAVGTLFMALISTEGPKLGLAQMIQSRPRFGYIGALLIWFVALVVFIGFNAFNQILAVQSVQAVLGGDKILILLLFTLASVAVAIIGYDFIHAAQRWIAAAMILALLVLSVTTLQLDFPAHQLALDDFRPLPFLAQTSASAAYMLSWSIYVSDYSRYLPKDISVRSSFWWTYVGCASGGAWMMLVGTFAAALYPQVDVATGVRQLADFVIPGFGAPLILVSLLALITMTAINFYGASLALLCVGDTLRPMSATVTKRVVLMLVAAAVGTWFALTASQDFMANFTSFLDVLLYLIAPWAAINLVDFFIVRKGHYSVREIFNPRGMYGLWNWRGLVSYAVGFVAMIPFFRLPFFTGPVAAALNRADISMPVGLVVSAVCYWLVCRSLDLEADRARAAAADVGLDPHAGHATAADVGLGAGQAPLARPSL